MSDEFEPREVNLDVTGSGKYEARIYVTCENSHTWIVAISQPLAGSGSVDLTIPGTAICPECGCRDRIIRPALVSL